MLLKTTLLLVSLLPLVTVIGQNTNSIIKVDTTITGFRYATNFDGMAVYTKNGISDISSDIPPSAFSVIVSQEITVDQAKQEFFKLIQISALVGYELRDRFEKDTIINGNNVYLISYREMLEADNYENRVFNGIIELK